MELILVQPPVKVKKGKVPEKAPLGISHYGKMVKKMHICTWIPEDIMLKPIH